MGITIILPGGEVCPLFEKKYAVFRDLDTSHLDAEGPGQGFAAPQGAMSDGNYDDPDEAF